MAGLGWGTAGTSLPAAERLGPGTRDTRLGPSPMSQFSRGQAILEPCCGWRRSAGKWLEPTRTRTLLREVKGLGQPVGAVKEPGQACSVPRHLPLPAASGRWAGIRTAGPLLDHGGFLAVTGQRVVRSGEPIVRPLPPGRALSPACVRVTVRGGHTPTPAAAAACSGFTRQLRLENVVLRVGKRGWF